MTTTTCRFSLALALLAGCGDDTTAADGSGSTSSTGSTSEESVGSAGPTGGATGSSSSTDASSSEGGDVSTSTGDDPSGTSSGSSSVTDPSTTSDSSSSDTTDETGGMSTVCEDGGDLVLQWGLQVPGGVYPDDIPTDLVETCAYTPQVGALALSCPSVDLVVTVESTPAVDLPADASNVDVRLHRAVGPLGFPDFWMEIDFDGGQNFSFVSSSVFDPPNATVELPHSMALSDQDCGPFDIGTPFEPMDPCGEQMWLGVELDLDAQLTVFHGSYAAGTSAGEDVGVWVGTARDYGTLPQFCDFAPAFFTTMVVTG
ncbi:MAG: hypothetical protein ACE37F_01980 [Nannocystaceae bacterium]|nr:hypothetical protein [bacterium]